MTIKEKERLKDSDTVPKEKPKRPQNWKVIMHHDAVYPVACASCVLREVFKMSSVGAMVVVMNAHKNGAEVVYEAAPDIARTKAMDAEQVKEGKMDCFQARGLDLVKFTAEPT